MVTAETVGARSCRSRVEAPHPQPCIQPVARLRLHRLTGSAIHGQINAVAEVFQQLQFEPAQYRFHRLLALQAPQHRVVTLEPEGIGIVML